MADMSNDVDSDWLGTADTLPAPASVPPPRTGVWRCDAEGENETRFDSLIEAQRELPLSPEARIVTYIDGRPVLLAEATRDDERRGWVFTSSGAARIVADASGVAA